MSAVQHRFLVVHQIESHTGKRSGQLVEIDGIIIARSEMFQHAVHIDAFDESSGILVGRFVKPNLMIKDIDALVFAVIEGYILVGCTVAKHIAPVDISEDTVHQFCIIAHTVESAHDTSYRSAGDDINGDTSLLQHFDNTYVGCALGTSAGEHQSHLLSLGCLILSLDRSQAGHQQDASPDKQFFHFKNCCFLFAKIAINQQASKLSIIFYAVQIRNVYLCTHETHRLPSAGHLHDSHLGCDVCQHQSAVAIWIAADGDIFAPFHRGLSLYLDHFTTSAFE